MPLDWSRYGRTVTRNSNPTPDLIEEFAAFLTTYRELDPDEARTTLSLLWSQLHAPGHWFKQESLVAMFKFLSFTTDVPERPNEPTIKLWRGQLLSDEPTCISWTTDHAVSHAYATELSKDFHTVCITAQVPRHAVLARFAFEDEYIVDSTIPFTSEVTCRLACQAHPSHPHLDRTEWLRREAQITKRRSRT